MSKQVVQSDKAPAPIGPYSQAIRAEGALLFTSGQIPIDPETGSLVEGDITAQTRQVFANLEAVLAAGNATFDDVVKVGVYLKDMGDFPVVNALYAEYFAEESAPARSTVEVARLPKDVAIEIDMIAVL